MDPTPSLWEGILRRASAMRRRYANLSDVPQDTWSLVNRVAAEKFAGGMPAAESRGHLYGLWTKAMYCVLNDLHRREGRRTGERLELRADLPAAERDGDTVRALDGALRALAERDAEMGEEKATIVALKYFEGLTWEELASTLGSSVRKVRDEWDLTRAWLRRELRRQGVDLG